ncbi:MAG TPA: hypothetical protein VJT74_05620, partial [Pyrinomonadaceae bacterium]|nr:hypothetical protein [Pyrinomonadaceae bacterium]
MEVLNVSNVGARAPADAEAAPYWIWPLRLPQSARRATYDFAGLAEAFCAGPRWVPASVAAGAVPFLISYATG